MESPIAFAILHQPVPFFIPLAAVLGILLHTLGKIIFIDEIIASVVGRIDVDHLYFAQVGFPEDFKGIQVVPFNVYIFAINVPPGVQFRLTDFFRSRRRVLVVG